MIKIDPEFRDLIPPLTDEELQALKLSIEKEGIRDSIHTWNGLIVDGHNRYAISQELNIDCPSREINFATRNDAIIWIIQNQFGRRNLSAYQRSTLVLKLEPLIKEKAKEKQRESGGAVPQKSAQPHIETRQELAKLAGVSHDTISKVKRIEASENEEVKGKVQSGEMSINKAYQKIRKPVYIDIDKEEEVFIEETKSFEKDKLKQIGNMIIDELFKTIEIRLARTKSNREVKRVLLSLIKKLSDWADQL